MRKLVISLVFIIGLVGTSFGAKLNMNNSSEFFRNQPCYELDNSNPSGEGHIITKSTLNGEITPVGYIEPLYIDKGQSSPVLDVRKDGRGIKCRIHSVVFMTTLFPENFIQFAPGIIEIRFRHTDGNYYMLKYDEREDLYRAYTPEEWEQRFAELQTIMSNITLK